MKKMEGGKGERGRMALVSLRNMEEKRKVWEMKKSLRGRTICIEDLTWNKRKTRWRLRQIALKEEVKGRRVWIRELKGKGELKIDGKWWRWDEVKKELRDEGGRRSWGWWRKGKLGVESQEMSSRRKGKRGREEKAI